MAKLVGVFAASHGPLMAREWHALPATPKERLDTAFHELARRFDAARPDVLIVVSPDHWVNFFINNLPSVCLGIGEAHDGPPEPFMKDFPHKPLVGHPALARHILETALAADFDPAVSHHLTIDHGFCIPLWRMALERLPPLIPLIVNDLEPPMPSLRRCFGWGRMLATAIASYPADLRVAIVATGGLSHSIGEPTMGSIDEAFDRRCIAALEKEDDGAGISALAPSIAAVGNGTHELRNWVVAHGAAGGRGFELVDYLQVPEVYVGCGFGAWNTAPRQ